MYGYAKALGHIPTSSSISSERILKVEKYTSFKTAIYMPELKGHATPGGSKGDQSAPFEFLETLEPGRSAVLVLHGVDGYSAVTEGW